MKHLPDVARRFILIIFIFSIFNSQTVSEVKMHRTKCGNIVKNGIALHLNEDLIPDLGQGKFILLLDGFTEGF